MDEALSSERAAEASMFRGKYLSVISFKRDGTSVATPVWFVEEDGRLLVGTDAASGKVKRIRRHPQVRVAVCTGTGWPSRQSCDAKGLALVFSGESLPGGLLRYADRRSDPGPADAPVAQAADMVVQRGVGLGGHGLNPRQAGEQLVVGLLGRRAELRHRLAPHVRQFLREDPIAEIDAFVADVDTRTGDEPGHRVLVLPAERPGRVLRPGGATRGLRANRQAAHECLCPTPSTPSSAHDGLACARQAG